jgi:hypothetical protein
MGSFLELNDTLQITREQGFPEELQFEQHKSKPYSAEQFKDKIFSFQNKNDIRCYQQPPVRCFLVENNNGEWVYWGHVFIQSITHDYNKKTTSGTYKIVRIYKPDEMETAKNLIEFRGKL